MANPQAGRVTADPGRQAVANAGREKARRTRLITTPEGIQVTVALADRGERAGAVILDLLFILLGLAVGVLALFGLEDAGVSSDWLVVIGFLMFFLARNFYFIFFELRWQGRTPGKRLMNLRVIDRRGGTLSADAVFARNLVREVELFIPMMLVLSGTDVGLGAWETLFEWLWIGVFLLFPFFNKDRMRIGDLIAGTWVVVSPKASLLSDLSEETRQSPTPKKEGGSVARSEPDAAPHPGGLQAVRNSGPAVAPEPPNLTFTFTDKQLDIYGIFELQTLEEVLRRSGPEAQAVRAAVADRIRAKIGHGSGAGADGALTPGQVVPFLDQFYKALRQRLEARMLLGDRKESKYD